MDALDHPEVMARCALLNIEDRPSQNEDPDENGTPPDGDACEEFVDLEVLHSLMFALFFLSWQQQLYLQIHRALNPFHNNYDDVQ